MRIEKLSISFITIISGQTLAYALSFLRNLILARMLTRVDYGLAATFALAVSMLDLNSKMGLGRQVVQSEEGDAIIFQNTAHSFQLLNAAISAGMILLLCIPMAYLFKVPDKIWAFALLSFVPVFRGLCHLDFQRYQRHFEFLPSIWVELVPQAIITALVWPLVHWIADFRVVLIIVIGKEMMTMSMTHWLARRPYRLEWDNKLVGSMWVFSWPLILNGFLIFAAQQADQMLVGGGFSLEILAVYSACASLISAIFQILIQATAGIMLPVLSRVQGFADQFNRKYEVVAQAVSIGAVATMVPVILAGEQIIRLFYGSNYAGGGAIMAWLAAGCAFRFIRAAPATAAMARSDTHNQMLTNLFRNSSLILGSVAVFFGFAVEVIAICAMIGEIIALIASMFLLRLRQSVPVNATLKPTISLSVWLTVAGLFVWLGTHRWNLLTTVGFSIVLILVYLIVFKWLFPELFDQLFREVSAFHKRD